MQFQYKLSSENSAKDSACMIIADNGSTNQKQYWLLSYPIMPVESLVDNDISHDGYFINNIL